MVVEVLRRSLVQICEFPSYPVPSYNIQIYGRDNAELMYCIHDPEKRDDGREFNIAPEISGGWGLAR